MARTQFYYHEKGNHDETWHYLCDDGAGNVHVETETSAGPGRGDMEISKPYRRSVAEFLEQDNSTAKNKLIALLDDRGIPHA